MMADASGKVLGSVSGKRLTYEALITHDYNPATA